MCVCLPAPSRDTWLSSRLAGRSKAEATWVPICARQRARVGGTAEHTDGENKEGGMAHTLRAQGQPAEDREAEDSGQHYPDTGHSLQCEVKG